MFFFFFFLAGGERGVGGVEREEVRGEFFFFFVRQRLLGRKKKAVLIYPFVRSCFPRPSSITAFRRTRAPRQTPWAHLREQKRRSAPRQPRAEGGRNAVSSSAEEQATRTVERSLLGRAISSLATFKPLPDASLKPNWKPFLLTELPEEEHAAPAAGENGRLGRDPRARGPGFGKVEWRRRSRRCGDGKRHDVAEELLLLLLLLLLLFHGRRRGSGALAGRGRRAGRRSGFDDERGPPRPARTAQGNSAAASELQSPIKDAARPPVLLLLRPRSRRRRHHRRAENQRRGRHRD